MKTRFFCVLACACMLLSCLSVGVNATTDESASEAFYAPLTFTASYGTTNGATLSALTAMTEADVQALTAGTSNGVVTDSSTGIPCQVFAVDVSSCPKENVLLTLQASTIENERLALKVLNPTTEKWDTVATAITSANGIGGNVNVATYAKDGKITAMAVPDYVANGSNRILWSTDQQHYTKFEDLNETYYAIHEYMVEEYKKDNVAYVINTGDIVDDNPRLSGAKAQWLVADKAFDILDEGGVPYGIVSGNHDVGDYPANNYSFYLEHFNEERYTGKPWYGGTEDDNKCHYDLVTVGNVDLLILYFGYGQGETQTVLEWANEVIGMYPHRSVILCTHQYLKPTTLDHAGRGKTLYEKVVLPNENVVMVLSGHYDGAGYRTQNEDGRIIQEVVADYQFVQAEDLEYYDGVKDPSHKIGGVLYCNGEGYIRDVIIEGNTVKMFAFSPVTGGETPFGLRDDYTLEVPFAQAQRRITTYRFTAGYEADTGTPITTMTDENGTTYLFDDAAAGSDHTATYTADKADLQALIAKAEPLKRRDYTAETFTAFRTALKSAKSAVRSDLTEQIRLAYTNLATAMGSLEEKSDQIDPARLTMVEDFDLNLSKWENGDGTKGLFTDFSFLDVEQLEDGGFSAKASENSPNTWPAIVYTEPITFTPEDGKVYLYLDLEAGSTWSFYPTVIQDKQQYQGRWNYVIEGSFKNDLDAGGGIYKGVFDVTQALVDMGVDVEKEMTLKVSINTVPGPLVIHDLDLLTGEERGLFTADNVKWFVLGGVGVVGIAAVAFALLYKPKKKEEE